MLHTVEDLIRRLDVMKNKAIQMHRIRNQYSDISGKEYDYQACKILLEDIQSMARLIAEDTQGTEIKTEMEYKKNEDSSSSNS